MGNDADINIQCFWERLSDNDVRSLVGAIVHVPVGGDNTPEGASYLGHYLFARVLSVTARVNEESNKCPRCETKSTRFRIKVEWEKGYQSPNGCTLCENCLDGVVKTGQEYISFDDAPR